MNRLPLLVLLACTPAFFAACSKVGGEAAAAHGRITVHVALYGGPVRPDGHMALSDSPAAGEPVVAIGAGHRFRGTTDAAGRATLSVPAGRYRVGSGYCGAAQTVAVRRGGDVRIEIQCDVP